jgi:hypothetical protein
MVILEYTVLVDLVFFKSVRNDEKRRQQLSCLAA